MYVCIYMAGNKWICIARFKSFSSRMGESLPPNNMQRVRISYGCFVNYSCVLIRNSINNFFDVQRHAVHSTF